MVIGTRTKAKIPPIAAGMYMAICVGIYDLGEQQTKYDGKTKYVNQVQFVFELPAEQVEVDGEMKPRQLSRTFAVSAAKKSNLRKFLTSWRGKAFSSDKECQDFNTDEMLGRSAMIQVVLNDTGEYANIDGVMQIPKGMPTPTTETELHVFNIDQWDDATFAALPEWVQEKIKNSTQYQQMHAPETAVDFPEPEEQPQQAALEEGVECPF